MEGKVRDLEAGGAAPSQAQVRLLVAGWRLGWGVRWGARRFWRSYWVHRSAQSRPRANPASAAPSACIASHRNASHHQAQQNAAQELRRVQEASEAQRAALQGQLDRAQAQISQLRRQQDDLVSENSALQEALQPPSPRRHLSQGEPRSPRPPQPRASETHEQPSGLSVGWSEDNCAVREVHALRAELGVSQAEAAQLRRQLEAAAAASHEQLRAAQREILRLQALADDAGTAAGPAAAGPAAPQGSALLAGAACARGGSDADAAEAAAECLAPKPSEESEPWSHVLDNPAFATEDCAASEAPADDAPLAPPAAPAQACCGDGWCEARAREMAETVGSLRRQLRQQERAIAALQKRRGAPFVHDSAASRSAWADALGLAAAHEGAPARGQAAGAGPLLAPKPPASAEAAAQTDPLAPPEPSMAVVEAAAAAAATAAAAAAPGPRGARRGAARPPQPRAAGRRCWRRRGTRCSASRG
jgi:hypothetical protein